MNNYEDIINMPHHVSSKRVPMSLEHRAAQFAPFSALTGYNEKIKETSRITNKKIELEEENKIKINLKLQILNSELKNTPEITITFFENDKSKEGGKYITLTTYIKKIDTYQKTITLENNRKILFDNIYNIQSKIFNNIIDN